VTGLEHYPAPSKHPLVVPNHLSFADGPLLAAFQPGEPVFVIDTLIAKRWWVRPFLVRMPVIRVDPHNRFVIRTMIQEVKDKTRLVLLPEGGISETGGLMKICDGPGMIADKAAAKLVPVRIEGAQFTRLSCLRGKLHRRWFPRISITVLPLLSLSLHAILLGWPRRHAAARSLRDVMIDAAFVTQNIDRTLFGALIDAGSRHAGGPACCRMPMTSRSIIVIFSRAPVCSAWF
jgi:acyl-[acyl-carrier-protein]-phospholipid O-acyltransferase / long-chain-fatty-acid--[acyl-carrier-protein] ligase